MLPVIDTQRVVHTICLCLIEIDFAAMLSVSPHQRVVILLVLQEFIIMSMLPVISPQRVVLM
jgi:hypothetical protein